MGKIFAPGCGLKSKKKEAVQQITKYLVDNENCSEKKIQCCRSTQDLTSIKEIITACPGCHRMYKKKYENANINSLWETLDKTDKFILPKYDGMTVALNDSCVTRKDETMQSAIRSLLTKMHITVLEPELNKENAKCCGLRYKGKMTEEQLKEKISERASELPHNDVVVYCTGCLSTIATAGKNTIHLLDLVTNNYKK